MTTHSQPDVIVIGAGVSGLIAARTLQATGARVLVLDKGRGVGGRMATRRTDWGVFDHGAQFLTARDPQFRLLVEAWQAEGIVRPWATGFALADDTFKRDGEVRFCGLSGMTAIPKHLAQGLDMRVNAKVTRVQAGGDGWAVTTEAGERFSGRTLLLTPPVPQSLELLAAGATAGRCACIRSAVWRCVNPPRSCLPVMPSAARGWKAQRCRAWQRASPWPKFWARHLGDKQLEAMR